MFVEVHYYDPYDFTLKEEGGLNHWGEPYNSMVQWAVGDKKPIWTQHSHR